MEADGGSTSESVGGSCISTESSEPRDARVVRELLRSMGIGDGEYEPRVIHRFLDFSYRYVADVLSDTQVYSDHAGKPVIDEDDVRLAIQSKVNSSFSQPPPRQMMLDLAKLRNQIPLPKKIAPPGSIPLPPEQHTLISPNYQLLVPRNQPLPQVEETEEDEEAPAPNLPQTQTNTTDQQQQQAPQRVSFTLGAAAKATRTLTKRS